MPSHSPLLLVVAVAAAVFSLASAAKLRDACPGGNNDCAGIEHAQCADEKCVCAQDYFPNFNGTLCHHKTEAYRAQCRDLAECQAAIGVKAACMVRPLSNDTATYCLCITGNHYNTTTHNCHRNLQLNDKCTGDVEGSCYLLLDGDNQHVRCASNGTCACEDGYVPDLTVMKCSSAPRLEWLSLSCLLGLLVVALAS